MVSFCTPAELNIKHSQRRDEVQIKIREMFSTLRLAVKRRQRYTERRACVLIELKSELPFYSRGAKFKLNICWAGERLTAEFESLYNGLEMAEALAANISDKDSIAQFSLVGWPG